MTFSLVSYAVGFLAGLLSTLSPCVLPIIPILLGSAINAHPRAPLALSAGLALSYAVVGTTLAWAGSAFNVDPRLFRTIGAVLLGLLGIILLSGELQRRFAMASSGISNTGNRFIDTLKLTGLRGQFVIGLTLGVVWSPCVGPTLGAAIVLASQGSHLTEVAVMMGIFGLGAATPVVILAHISRSAFFSKRNALLTAGKIGKVVLGAVLLAVSALILSGIDKSIEAWLVEQSPLWLTRLTTQY